MPVVQGGEQTAGQSQRVVAVRLDAAHGGDQLVFLSESDARTYAADRSTDQRVLDPRSNRSSGYYPADGHPAHG